MAGNRASQGFLARLAKHDAAPAIVLMACSAVALALANSPLAVAFSAVLHDHLGWVPLRKIDSLHAMVNDALMAVFFFVVGLEIKREVLAGDLADPARRRLPVIAALAGMAMPALAFLAATLAQPDLHRGWAIPAATDIAFATGVLALLGPRVPRSLRLFLLTVAIVDDLGAVVVIALFYTAALDLLWLLGAAAILGVLVGLNLRGTYRPGFHAALSVALWFCVLHSGVHATVAGVLAALTVPLALDRRHDSPLLRLEHALVPVSGFVIVPLFGLANAGVALNGPDSPPLTDALPLGILLGLFVGKQVGILGAILGAEALGLARRPAGAGLMHLWGMALLCGIGFTMSLFIGALAFPDSPALVEEAKLGVLAGSLLSALAGAAMLRLAPRTGA